VTKGTGPSTVIAVRVKQSLIQAVDRRRGDLSRSAYLRRLVEKDVRK
jgi:hypothetical protein